MSTFYDRLRAALPMARFQPAATPERIAGVEQVLGTRFPVWLRDLYLQCDGIQPLDGGTVYLYPLERSDACSESLVSWNQFHREQWLQNLPACKQFGPEVEWDRLDPHQLLIVGGNEVIEWAIQPDAGPQIISYDVRNPDYREVIAADLVDACVKNEQELHEIHEKLFRGRELYRGDSTAAPASCDVDRVFDIIVALHKPRNPSPGIRAGTGWWLNRAISKHPGDQGELFILPVGMDDEVRIISRDGNLPFIMRLKAWPFDPEFACIVWTLKDALMRILLATDAIRLPYVDDQRPRPDECALRRIWRDAGAPELELARVAEVLGVRDNRRRLEPNRLGGASPG